MKKTQRHRIFFAALLVLPLVAAAAAHADSDGSHDRTDSSHHYSGDHHDSGGDGQNDDGNSPSAVSPSSSSVPSSASVPANTLASGSAPLSTGGSDGEHRRFGDIVSSPTLDPQQTKAVIANGKAASMPLLLAYLNQNYPGQVLDVKLHSASDGFVYEVRYLSDVVFLRTLFLDAATLKAK